MTAAELVVEVVPGQIMHTEQVVVAEQVVMQEMVELATTPGQAAAIVLLLHVKVAMALLDQVAEEEAPVLRSDAEIRMDQRMLVVVVE
jgi:hypothetical protein